MNKVIQKEAGVRLLAEVDKGLKNVFGFPVVGWLETSDGFGGIHNPRGFACLRVVMQKMIKDIMEDIYDQPMLVENPGSIIIAKTEDDHIGMVENFRMIGDRPRAYDLAKYIKYINDNNLWAELLSTLGKFNLEVPRGIAAVEGETAEEIFLNTAKCEALEEAGFVLSDMKIAGYTNTNPTFFAHAQAVISGNIVTEVESQNEDYEIIGKTHLLSAAKIRELVDKGELTDGLTQSGLAIVGFHF